MEEATGDKRSSAIESKKDLRKTQGWIRMHSDESAKTLSADDPEDSAAKSQDHKVRKLEKPAE